jgi:uncharacterized phage protein (TIGR02218 family)
VGIQPTELDILAYAGPADIIGGEPWQAFAISGNFDNAIVELDRLFMPPAPTSPPALDLSLGAIVWFYGKVADVEVSRTTVHIHVKSLLNILQEQQMPRRLFQSGCNHVFGDPMCGYDRVNGNNAQGNHVGPGQIAGTALAGSGPTFIISNINPDQVYAQGTCTFVSGANSGTSRAVDGISGSMFSLKRAFSYPVQVGDVFDLLPGCDHTVNTCNNVFNNLLNYGGFPYIPPPELAL